MQFILEICDPDTECVIQSISFEVDRVEELCGLLNMSTFDPYAVYELEKDDIQRIEKRYSVGIGRNMSLVRLRSHHALDDLPYQIHTNRELILMLAGTKPLAVFTGEYPPLPDIEEIPERLFDSYVATGRFVKREYVEPKRYGRSLGIRRILYSLPSESWRIDAYILMQLTASKTGWNESFERMEGSLLGYAEWQNDAYIEFVKKQKGQHSV